MIEGKFFHKYKWNDEGYRHYVNGERQGKKEIHIQGKVMEYNPEQNMALVLLYAWGDGSPNGQYLKTVTDDWVFYETEEEMQKVWIRTLPYDRQEWARRLASVKRWEPVGDSYLNNPEGEPDGGYAISEAVMELDGHLPKVDWLKEE